MLVDIEFKQELIDESNTRLKESCSTEDYEKYHTESTDDFCYRFDTGIYETTLNFHFYIEIFSEMKIKTKWDSFSTIRKIDGKIDFHYLNECNEKGIESKSNYGVCDNYQQVLDKYPELNDANRRFVLSICLIEKKKQPAEGGWRWHKWGPYIGNHQIQCEYIYDEVGIEEVYVYHIYEME